jgi:hypothetical protein
MIISASLPVITCEWCDQPATRVTHSDEPVCLACASDDHGSRSEALANTLALGKGARARIMATMITRY